MIVCKNTQELQDVLTGCRKDHKTIGFVPTMGALHQGHISLIERAQQLADITVCSIFINPTQFNDKKDFEKYPVNVSADLLLLERSGCNIVFLPTVAEMYPAGFYSALKVPLGRLSTVMEARQRPGHFEGVLQVVKLLLDKVQPDILFLGAKDFQQCAVIRKLIKSCKLKVRLVVCPTIREPDGLAMSSRNMRLTERQRKDATILSHVLLNMQSEWKGSSPSALRNKYLMELKNNKSVRVEYLEIVDADTLMSIRKWDAHQSVQACVAAWVGDVRLIDNVNLF